MDALGGRFANQLRRVRLLHLEVLLAIAEHESLSATARAIGCSQPAISQWLADIEDALGVALFVRGRTLRGTTALPIVLRHVRRMVADSQQLARELQAAALGVGASLTIGTMPVASASLLPKALLRLRRQSAAPRISVVEDIAQGLWERFERRELDLIVGRLDDRAHAATVRAEVLFADPHCVVVAPGHALLRGKATWPRAARHAWILPPADTRLRDAIDATFVDHGLAPPVPWLESTSPTLNQMLMREAGCVSVLSGAAARHYEAARLLRILPLRLRYDAGPIGMAWDEHAQSPALLLLVAALRTAARAE